MRYALITGLLLLLGALSAGLRWGREGVRGFGAVWRRACEGWGAGWANRRQLWVHPVLRLLLLVLLLLMTGWAADAVRRGGLSRSLSAMDQGLLEPSRDERRLWGDRSYHGIARLILGETAGPVDSYARRFYQHYLRDRVWKETDRGAAFERELELKRQKRERAGRRAVPP